MGLRNPHCQFESGYSHMARDAEKQRAHVRTHYANNKAYYLAKNERRRLELRNIVREAKSKPCMDCGVSYPYYIMDLDHRPGEIKLYTPSQLSNLGNKTALLAEIAKCDAVCSNCHRVRSYQRSLNGKDASREGNQVLWML